MVRTRVSLNRSLMVRIMAMRKRFVYWTSDGKRHWSPFLNITLDLSESAKFREADKLYDCHTRNELLALVRPKLAFDMASPNLTNPSGACPCIICSGKWPKGKMHPDEREAILALIRPSCDPVAFRRLRVASERTVRSRHRDRKSVSRRKGFQSSRRALTA